VADIRDDLCARAHAIERLASPSEEQMELANLLRRAANSITNLGQMLVRDRHLPMPADAGEGLPNSTS
jgi:hypothetical protein